MSVDFVKQQKEFNNKIIKISNSSGLRNAIIYYKIKKNIRIDIARQKVFKLLSIKNY